MTPVDAKEGDKRLARDRDDDEDSSTSSSAAEQHRVEEEKTKKQWDKPVMLRRGATGKVKWFNIEKGRLPPLRSLRRLKPSSPLPPTHLIQSSASSSWTERTRAIRCSCTPAPSSPSCPESDAPSQTESG
jgi:hypothetical protein